MRSGGFRFKLSLGVRLSKLLILTRSCHLFPQSLSLRVFNSEFWSPVVIRALTRSLDSTPLGFTNVRGILDLPRYCQPLVAVSQRKNIYIPLVIVRTDL